MTVSILRLSSSFRFDSTSARSAATPPELSADRAHTLQQSVLGVTQAAADKVTFTIDRSQQTGTIDAFLTNAASGVHGAEHLTGQWNCRG